MSEVKRYLDEMNGHGPFIYNDAGSRPPVVMISVDMVPVEFYLGNERTARTPNMDRLRDDGVNFSNAFCTSPLCSPSRASFLTGRYSYITTNVERAHEGHEIHLRDEDIIFPEYLKNIGYHVRHVGKSHVGTHKFVDVFGENDSPWDRWSPPWNDDDDYIEFLAQKGFSRFSFERTIYGADASGEGKGSFFGGWIAPQNGKPFPKDATYPAYLVDRAIRALKARPADDTPLYLELDFFGPHQPFAIPAGMEEREREIRAALTLPESYRRLSENGFIPQGNEPRVYRMYRKNWGLVDPDTVIDYLVANILQYELLDEVIGRFIEYLEAEGVYERACVFFLADHGEMNAESALIDKGAYLNPRVIRVPFSMKPPAGTLPAAGGTSVESPVSLLDLVPTVLELVGIQTDSLLDGVSLFRTISGAPRPSEKPILFEIWSHVVPNPAIGIVFRAGDGELYMFTYNATDDIDELYRLSPENRSPVNLFHDAEFQNVLDEAVAVMAAVLSRDKRWRGYYSFFTLEYAERLGGTVGDRQVFV